MELIQIAFNTGSSGQSNLIIINNKNIYKARPFVTRATPEALYKSDKKKIDIKI